VWRMCRGCLPTLARLQDKGIHCPLIVLPAKDPWKIYNMFSLIALSLCRHGLDPDFGLKCNMPALTQVALLFLFSFYCRSFHV
jgi:hypothetical protein